MIEVKNLVKRYGDFTAVHDLSFTVGKGEVLGFLGPNGAGKTTTMRILTGFLPPTSGSISVAGFDVLNQPLDAKRRIGYLPEMPPLYTEMTVKSFLKFVSKIKDIPKASRAENIRWALEKCDIVDVQNKVIDTLSKGYRQRVGLAQAIVHKPEVLVLDEPTVGLDPRQIREIRGLIKELSGDHTVILSTHILAEVAVTCERVAIINRGHLAAHGSINEITGGRSLEEVFIDIITKDVAADKGGSPVELVNPAKTGSGAES